PVDLDECELLAKSIALPFVRFHVDRVSEDKSLVEPVELLPNCLDFPLDVREFTLNRGFAFAPDVQHRRLQQPHVVVRLVFRNARYACDDRLRRRPMYLLTLVSRMLMPSLSNSPWIHGAPHSGFSRLIGRINSRTSCGTAGRPGRP